MWHSISRCTEGVLTLVFESYKYSWQIVLLGQDTMFNLWSYLYPHKKKKINYGRVEDKGCYLKYWKWKKSLTELSVISLRRYVGGSAQVTSCAAGKMRLSCVLGVTDNEFPLPHQHWPWTTGTTGTLHRGAPWALLCDVALPHGTPWFLLLGWQVEHVPGNSSAATGDQFWPPARN